MTRGRRLRRWGKRLVQGALALAVVYGAAGYLTSRLEPAPKLVVEPLAEGAPGEARTADDVGGESLVVWNADPAREPLASWLAGGTEVRGVLSVHSGRSHDSEGTFDEIALAAARTGLDFVMLGDHPGDWLQEEGALDPVRNRGVLLIPGQEMVIMETGRVLAVGLEADTLVERWEGTVDELVARIAAVDGYAGVVHARSPRPRERWHAGVEAPGIHGWETLDVSEVARLRLADRWVGYHLTSFLAGLATGRAQGPVLRLNREGTSAPGLLAYDSARALGPLTLTAGLNHHPKARIAGRLVPPYTPFFRTLVNHVVLDAPLSDDPRMGRQEVLQGLRAGGVFVSLGEAEAASGFRFGPLGDETLAVRLPPGATGRFFIRVLRDGEEIGWVPVRDDAALTIRPPGPGVYRVELTRAGVPVGPWRHGLRPWILSNAVDLGAAASTPPSPARTLLGAAGVPEE